MILSDADDRQHDDGWDVTECGCGQLTLRIGAVRLDFSREEFGRLHRLIEGAANEFQVGSIAPAAPTRSFLH